MTDYYEVDHLALSGIAQELRRASETVDVAGASVPRSPDAGEATAVIVGIVAQLAANAANLVVGLAGAAGDVDNANATYASSDEQSRRSFATGLRGW